MSERAGAMLLEETPQMTVAVRKDCVELVWKILPGVYLTVILCRVEGERGGCSLSEGTVLEAAREREGSDAEGAEMLSAALQHIGRGRPRRRGADGFRAL